MLPTTPWLLALLLALGGEGLAPRAPLAKDPLGRPALGAPVAPELLEHQLIVKFADAVRARAAQDGALLPQVSELAPARALAAQLGVEFAPLVRLPEARLAELEARAAARSGRAQPDLAGLLVAHVAGPLEDAAQRFRALESVEFAYVAEFGAPPPGDVPPTTPDLSGMQAWHAAPAGLDASALLALALDGSGIRLSDCEYGWVGGHEDLVDIDLHPEPGQTPHPNVAANGWDEHGTAVIGETSAVVNGYGCSGLVPAAEVYTFPEWTLEEGFRRVTAITNAIAGSAPGDVVLLEMQSGAGAPAEADPAVWLVVRAGTDAGVVVVGAAGNGNQNLDGASYASYTALGDSGAILVGAGTNSAAHAKLSFSTHGSRIDVQGWGTSVFTLGYGTFAAYGGDKNQRYTSGFNGTSSASPMVTIAAVALAQRAQQAHGLVLDSRATRALLKATGAPQTGGGGNIGPFPDLSAALAALDCPGQANSCVGAPNSTGSGASISTTGSASTSVDGLTLVAANLPPGQIAVFVYGQGSTQVPFGNGFLCIGGSSVFRLLPAAISSAAGVVEHELDLGALSGAGTIAPGSTWNFQCWYRDVAAGGAGFNLSDAIAVPFCD